MRRTLLVLVLSFGALACSGDDGGGGGDLVAFCASLAETGEGDFLTGLQPTDPAALEDARERLQDLKKKFPLIQEVRGRGLMLGAALSIPGAPLVLEGLKRGLILNCTQETVLRFVPPLIITEREIDEGIGILEGILADAGGGS